MIKKINQISGLGLLFDNYKRDAGTPDFEKVNLIFGWNGGGKTTLSRLFTEVGTTTLPGLQFEIEDDKGAKFKQNEPFPKQIRVFNHHYVQTNLSLVESETNAISLVLGEESSDILKEIESDQKLLDGDPSKKRKGKLLEFDAKVKELEGATLERDNKFTDIARTIGAAIGGNALRDYRRPQASEDFSKLKHKQILPDEELTEQLNIAKQEVLPSLDLIQLGTIRIDDDDNEVELAEFILNLCDDAKRLLGKTVQSETINRLSEHEDIAHWVEEGIRIHETHKSTVCEYCDQKIPHSRIEELAGHFSEADKTLKNELNGLIHKLEQVLAKLDLLQVHDKARFYANFQLNVESATFNFKTQKEQLLEDFAKVILQLKKKQVRTTQKLSLESIVDLQHFKDAIESVNLYIGKHNSTTKDFQVVKQAAREKLTSHYLSTIKADVDTLVMRISQLTEDRDLLQSDITRTKGRIKENTSKVSSKHKACDELNAKLRTFLGHQELSFAPRTEKVKSDTGDDTNEIVGYNILRGNIPAIYLSESEKTAIAFIYFVVHLRDEEFDLTEGIVVIDDPVSSFDTNSLYQAFSFLKNAVKDCKQVFVLTHNFEFLKLLLNWRKRAGGAGYFMLKNEFENGIRRAAICGMDKELYKYESEYHYLFKLLKQLRDEQDGTIARAYPVPTIARKVWDTFLMFAVPNGETPYKKMEELKKEGCDEQKLDAIYKFTNDQSHITGSGFNPSLVPESKKVIGEVFELMERIAPFHFKKLTESVS